ncbi:hypothetical protein DSECCO2_478090 [anaerobic digester metagenome]
MVYLLLDGLLASVRLLDLSPDGFDLAFGACDRRLLVVHETVKGTDLLLFLPDECRPPTLSEVLEPLLPPPVFHRLLALMLERVQPCHELVQEKFLALEPLPHHLELRERLSALVIELGDTRYLVDDLPPLAVGHLHDAGDITLHHDVVAFRLDPDLREKLDDVGLLAETVVEIVVTVVSRRRPLDPAANRRAVRERGRHLGGVLPGVDVDEIGQFLGPQPPRTREGQDEEDTVDDVALSGAVRA